LLVRSISWYQKITG